MQNKDDEKELFSSVKEVVGGSNDNLWTAILGAVVVAIVGTIVIRFGLGITGGLVAAIPAIAGFLVFKAIRNSSNNTK